MKTFQRQKYYQVFLESLNPQLTETSLKIKSGVVDKFLQYLDSRGVEDLRTFNIDIAYDYILSLKVSSSTISLTKFNLRAFFDSTYNAGMTDTYGKKIFPVIHSNKRDRIPSFYKDVEIRQMLASLDSGSKEPLKKRCMVLIATLMGLRVSDILNLKLSEIKWDKNLIELSQRKTGFNVSVPMPENIKLLLIDYIRNKRPKSKSEYVFLKKTGGNYTSNILYTFVSKAFTKSDVEIGSRKHGAHALRHSLATRLLKDDTPMHVITGILGHKNMNTTKQYLSISIGELRAMSLEVPEYEDN
jgi:integrase/recombinase XerD